MLTRFFSPGWSIQARATTTTTLSICEQEEEEKVEARAVMEYYSDK